MKCAYCGNEFNESLQNCPYCEASEYENYDSHTYEEYDTEYVVDDTPMTAFMPVSYRNESKGVQRLYNEEIGPHISIMLIVAIIFIGVVIVGGLSFLDGVFDDHVNQEEEIVIERESMASHAEAQYLLGYGLDDEEAESEDASVAELDTD